MDTACCSETLVTSYQSTRHHIPQPLKLHRCCCEVMTPRWNIITVETIYIELVICGSVDHQSILLTNQRVAALSSRIYYSLRDYCTCFVCFLHPSSGVQLKL
jgi:hypothetical protein